MATEQALQFIVRVNEDQSLRTKLDAIAKEGMAGLVKIAKDAGFDVSAEDLQNAAVEQWTSRVGEIPDEDLENIAGGVNGDGPVANPSGGFGQHPILIGLLLPAVAPQQLNVVKKFK